MKSNYTTKASISCLLCLIVFLLGGCINFGGCCREKYERTVQLSAPMQTGGDFEAHTHNGSITITGAEVADCNLTATITAWAMTQQEAQELAEEVKVTLVPAGNKLTVKIEKPSPLINKRVGVRLDATIPSQTSAELTTHNGALNIKNLAGQLNGTTHNGKVITEKISGTTKLQTHNGKIICKEAAGSTQLQTHNGSITCEDVSGNIKLRTHNGNANASYSKAAASVCRVSMVTHNGDVCLTSPQNFSAKVDASTHRGSIDTNLPITVTGKVSKRELTGTIGTGQGQLHLETHNGSIKIK